jgi:hypothetical protein
MNFLMPIMMWGWIPFTIFLFLKYSPQKATLINVIGGVLFLPTTHYMIPMIRYDKVTAIGLSLLCGLVFSGRIFALSFRPTKSDIPIIVWCTLSPFLSIMTNGLGAYNAIAAVVQTSLMWGVYYLAGRIFFSDNDSLRLLTKGIIIGGLIYVPLVFFEVRMSPQLTNIVYGFFPHSWFQHLRYGGYRPIVFMQHGLMVALWMAATYTVSLWLFKTREINEIKKIPMSLIVLLLLTATILCKSANGWVYSLLGTLAYYYHQKLKSKKVIKLIILIIPLYIILRISLILPAETIIDYLSKIFDAQRIESLSVRLFQEEVFGTRALESPYFGWGWMDFAWPIDPVTAEALVRMIDSLYLIMFSSRGYLGLASLYAVLLLGPWKIMKSRIAPVNAVVLSIVLIFFAIDSLLNGMINPVFILISGTLIGVSERLKDSRPSEPEKA